MTSPQPQPNRIVARSHSQSVGVRVGSDEVPYPGNLAMGAAISRTVPREQEWNRLQREPPHARTQTSAPTRHPCCNSDLNEREQMTGQGT
jgi:hypothetical protein